MNFFTGLIIDFSFFPITKKALQRFFEYCFFPFLGSRRILAFFFLFSREKKREKREGKKRKEKKTEKENRKKKKMGKTLNYVGFLCAICSLIGGIYSLFFPLPCPFFLGEEGEKESVSCCLCSVFLFFLALIFYLLAVVQRYPHLDLKVFSPFFSLSLPFSLSLLFLFLLFCFSFLSFG